MTRIGLFGAAGHMGLTLIRAIDASGTCTLAGGCERSDSPHLGADLGALAGLAPLGLAVTADAAALCRASDVVVDYSAASATMSLLPAAVAARTLGAVLKYREDQQRVAAHLAELLAEPA